MDNPTMINFYIIYHKILLSNVNKKFMGFHLFTKKVLIKSDFVNNLTFRLIPYTIRKNIHQ